MNSLFREDDFFALKNKYFTKEEYFNPAQSKDADITDAGLLRGKFDQIKDFTSYNNDPTESGVIAKTQLANLLLATDNVNVAEHEISITPSITSSSFITIKVLQELGVNKIWVETPCYYATLFQTKLLGMETELIPSYLESNFDYEIPDIKKGEAIWLTQPRISIAQNQNKDKLKELFSRSAADGFYVVVDEATELNMPSLVGELTEHIHDNIIRLRGIYKPLSINGPRIAYILHGKPFKSLFYKWVWTFHGGIDIFSINSLPNTASEVSQYSGLLTATKQKAIAASRLLKTLLIGSRFNLLEYDNGYTTCLYTKLVNGHNEDFDAEREKLIMNIEKCGLFPTLGPSMYFANDNVHEFIRINLFTDIDKFADTFSTYPTE